MNILLTARLFYPHTGGVETHTHYINQRLIKKGHKVSVITEQFDRSLPTNEVIDGTEVYRMPSKTNGKWKKYEIWSWMWKNRELIKEADIVHCHDVFFWYLPFRFIYPFKKVYITFHGYETRFPISKKAIVIRKLSEWLSHGNICVGEFIKKWYYTNPNYITYGGVNPYNQTVKVRPHKKLRIVFVGRISEDNGIFVYAEVLEILKNKGVEFEFIAVGDGKEKKELSRFGEVKGFVKQPEKYIETADIVFASSYLSILQAFIQKKLVISTYTNPLKKDYLKMTPFHQWIVSEQDPIQLAHAIIKYKNNPNAYNTHIDKAYAWSKEQSWDNVLSLYEKLWRI